MTKAQPCEACGARKLSLCSCVEVYSCIGCGKTFERRVYYSRKNNCKYCEKNCPALTKHRKETSQLPFHKMKYNSILVLKETQ